MSHAPDLPAHSAGQVVTDWGISRLHGPATLTPRSEIGVGDVVHSSHYGRQTVVAIDYSGNERETTRLVFDESDATHKAEIYRSSQLIPLYFKATRKVMLIDELGGSLTAVLSHKGNDVRITVSDAEDPARIYLGPAERRELAALLLEGLAD